MTTTLYIEPFAGMAGDMFLAALLDLKDPRFTLEDLRGLAGRLVPGEARLTVETAWRGNLSGQMLTVETPESAHPPHRRIADVERIVRDADLPPPIVERALAVFRRIAVAEGTVHGCSPDEVHFHEVGAVDTIVDVVGAAFALHKLGVERVHASVPLTGTGTVRCAHGEMPVPTPAVAEILRGRAMLVAGGHGERLTPTGAALLAELAPEFAALRAFTPERIGYGAGHRDPKDGPPNILRVQLGSVPPESAARATAWLAEVNLDDMSGEELAFAAERAFAAGALDVWSTPVVMKKGRPGVVLSALVRNDARAALEKALFEQTSTLGIRWREVERSECERRTIEVVLHGAKIRVKVRQRPGSAVTERDLSPEHDDLAALARSSGASIRELERAAIAAGLRERARIAAARDDGMNASSAAGIATLSRPSFQPPRDSMRLLLASLCFLISGCVTSTQSTQQRAGVLEFLYPEGTTATPPQDVKLTLPLRVGIAFAPETGKRRDYATGFDESRHQAVLERIAAAFRGVDDVQRIEIIPTTYLRQGGGFENLDQLKSMYGIDVIALLSYEQTQFGDFNQASLTYWTIVGGYFIEGNENATNTFVDTSVFDIASRALLFNAAGNSKILETSNAVEAAQEMRKDSLAGFEKAVDVMIGQLQAALTAFREQAKSGTVRGPGTPALEVGRLDENGQYKSTGAAAVGPLELAAALALACGFLFRRRSA